jgi:hypothetical protein
LVRIVCHQCGIEEVCPSVLFEEYEEKHRDEMSDELPNEAMPED